MMTKKQAFELAERHNMTIARNPVTREGTGWYLQYVPLIPELDRLADTTEGAQDARPCAVVREQYGDEYTYRIMVPKGWISLWD